MFLLFGRCSLADIWCQVHVNITYIYSNSDIISVGIDTFTTTTMATQKISPYSLPDLKSTTDDALANYLRGLNFAQNNSKLDFRLYVGFTSVFVAGLTFVADYRLGWEATKGWTAVAVGVYMVLSAIYSYWMWAVEGGLVFEGVRDGKRVSTYPSPLWLPVRNKHTNANLNIRDHPRIKDHKARPNILPHCHNNSSLLLYTTLNMANRCTIHYMVHSGWLFRCAALSEMAG